MKWHRRRLARWWFGAVIALAATLPVSGADPFSRKLKLATGEIQTDRAASALIGAQQPFKASAPYIVQLSGGITPDQRRQLRDVGVRLGAYLPDNAFVVELGGVDPVRLAKFDFVQWAGRVRPEWKLSPAIGRRLVPFESEFRQDLERRGKVQLVVTLSEGAPVDAATDRLAAIGGTVTGVGAIGAERLINAIIDTDQVSAVAAIDQVLFVEEAPEITLRNNNTRWVVQSNMLNVTPLHDNGLHGEGQIVGVLDSKVDQDHCALDDGKILFYNTADANSLHGTHVSGIVVGDNGVFDNTRGLAYLANMVFNDAPFPPYTETDIVNRLSLHHSQGARIHTNSWGDDGTTNYNSLARGFDSFLYNNEDDFVCLAVTNQATLRNPENAKNLLAVGATLNPPLQNNHCLGGVGPTSDGRRKPEIYAPGCNVESAVPGACATDFNSGTSMACPAIAGVATLVRQYFMDGYYPSGAPSPADAITPSGALIKSVLLNSAADMTGVAGYPSNLEGWGRVLADSALYFAGDTRRLAVLADTRNDDGLNTGEMIQFTVPVDGATEQLRFTLVWTDPPASALTGGADAWINDLDLQVDDPHSITYLGNDFEAGESTTGGVKDSKNNVEQVHVSSPAVGVWTVRVLADAVNVGTQGFALVVSGDISVDCNQNTVPDGLDVTGGTSLDCDGDSIPDECQIDCNDNLVPDTCDIAAATSTDANSNALPDECEDCNNNGIADELDVAMGTSPDCNESGLPDECDITSADSTDCDTNGVPDECDTPDCNGNDFPDVCDLSGGTSTDCNINMVPDECDAPDCNDNNRPDECDILDLISDDCNANWIPDECDTPDCNTNGSPDECDVARGVSLDCNANLIPDECDLPDCNTNGIPDTCDVASIFSADCNMNDIPDECEIDCNGNGVADGCDVAAGTSEDCDNNGIPDTCDVVADIEDCRFPTRLLDNTTGAADSVYVGPPDDVAAFVATGETVTFDFHCGMIADGPGADFTVYEKDTVPVSFNEITVLVSIDGVDFVSVKSSETTAVDIPGDEAHGISLRARSYDLIVSGMPHARYVRIVGTPGAGAFPLDAIGAVHLNDLDCDDNAIPDACDLAAGSAFDCNSNGVLDVCDGDCDGNGLADECDMAAGSTADCNANNVLDACEINRSAQAIALDGADDYLDVGVSLDINQNLTIEAWILLDTTSDRQVIFAKRATSPIAGYALFVEDAALVFTNLGIQRFDGPAILQPGVWTHVAAVFDNTNTVLFYVNGQLVDNVSGSMPIASSSGAVFIGALPPSGGDHFDGVIDDVRVWSVSLDAETILTNMSTPPSGSEPGLESWWDFETGSGGTAFDSSGPNDALLLNGAAWVAGPDDCNGNGVLDQCDLSGGVSDDCNKNHILDECGDLPIGECTCDLSLDSSDFAVFTFCVDGPIGPAGLPDCACADIDKDNDVDLRDFGMLMEAMSP